MKVKTVIITFICVLITGLCHAIEESQALDYFDNFQTLGEKFDSKLISLYSDEARISTLRHYPTGQTKELVMNGVQWKALLEKVLPLAKTRRDVSTYSEIKVKTEGNKATITAHRHSELKEYTDESYYMIIAQSQDGDIVIVAEHTGTSP